MKRKLTAVLLLYLSLGMIPGISASAQEAGTDAGQMETQEQESSAGQEETGVLQSSSGQGEALPSEQETEQQTADPQAAEQSETESETAAQPESDENRLQALAFTQKSCSLDVIGEQIRLQLIRTPEEAAASLIWKSSDEAVVSVDASGQITAAANGSAVITVTSAEDPSVSASIEVRVAATGLSEAADGSGLHYYTDGVRDASVSGVFPWKTDLYLVEKGEPAWESSGFFKSRDAGDREEALWKVVNGKVDAGASGLFRTDQGWKYFKGGRMDKSYTGFAKNGSWWRMKDGNVCFGQTGIAPGTVEGVQGWYYFENGKVVYKDTLASYNNGLWRVKKGKVDFSSGLYRCDQGWKYFKGGRMDKSYTGFAQNGSWWRMKDGNVCFGQKGIASGTVEGEKAWWYFENGKVVYKDTLASYNNGLWRVVKGKVDFSSGLYRCDQGWKYFKGGRLDKSYTGFAQNGSWWRMKDGNVCFGQKGIASGTVAGEKAWWYFEDGKVTLKDTLSKNGSWWMVKDGKVDFDFSGLFYSKDYGWYLIKNGRADLTFTGFAARGSEWWYVRKGKVRYEDGLERGTVNGKTGWYAYTDGKVDFTFTGFARRGSYWYYVENGVFSSSRKGDISGTVNGTEAKWHIEGGRVLYRKSEKDGKVWLADPYGHTYFLYQRAPQYYQIVDHIDLPGGGYELTTANIGLKVIKVNDALGYSPYSHYERYDSETARRVRNFQASHNLPVTGTVDKKTWLALGLTAYDWDHLAAYVTPEKIGSTSKKDDFINAMVSTAKEYADKSTVYRVGSSGKPGTYADCSGLIFQTLYAAGINPAKNIIDHGEARYEYTSAYLAADPRLGRTLGSNESAKKGDLIFYANSGGSSVIHVAISAGNGKIYDAWPYRDTTYRSQYIYGTRIVKIVRIFE